MKAVSDRVRLSVAEARDLGERVLQNNGFDAEEARIITDHVVDAALCGYEYSGLPKILNVIEHPRLQKPREPMRVRRETPVSVLYDGRNNNGMFAMYRVTEAAIAKASKQGFAVAGVNNIWQSGRSAYYVEMAARAGLVGIHSVSATHQVAPPGAAARGIGTNPIAFGFPTLGEPLIVDVGTSAIMFTDLALRARLKQELPEGVAIDAAGRPTRDPVLAQQGAALSFGGYKGFALAVAMQALGVLAGSGDDVEKSAGYLMVVMKPDLLMSLEDYRRDLSAAIARLKATPRQPGVEEIRLPSARAFRDRTRNLRDGIEIDRQIYNRLQTLGL